MNHIELIKNTKDSFKRAKKHALNTIMSMCQDRSIDFYAVTPYIFVDFLNEIIQVKPISIEMSDDSNDIICTFQDERRRFYIRKGSELTIGNVYELLEAIEANGFLSSKNC